jgi:hypothetical protein
MMDDEPWRNGKRAENREKGTKDKNLTMAKGCKNLVAWSSLPTDSQTPDSHEADSFRFLYLLSMLSSSP